MKPYDEYSKWLLEGYFLKLYDPATREYTYYIVTQRERAEYEYVWSEAIASAAESGPETGLEDIEPLSTGRLYQTIFGIDVGVLIYVDFPQNTRRWGTDKKPKAASSNRYVGWIDNIMTPYRYPTFAAELFLLKGGSYEYPFLYGYNPTSKALTPRLHFIQNKLELEVISEDETLEKLEKNLIPSRFITLGGIPATRSGAG